MEFIKVRTTGAEDRLRALNFLNAVQNSPGEPGLMETKIYVQSSYIGDLSIAFYRDNDEPISMYSELALLVVNELKKMGFVHHSIWLEKGEGT